MGLVNPQNLQLKLVEVDICSTGTRVPTKEFLSCPPAFVTSDMKWWRTKMMLPPTFEMYPSDPQAPVTASGPVTDLPGTALPGTLEKPYPLAHIKYRGWQGFSHMTVDMTMYHFTRDMHFEPTLHTPDEGADIRSRWRISRVAWKREYDLTCTSNPANSTGGDAGSSDQQSKGCYKWHSTPPSEFEANPAADDGYPRASGNLVLSDPQSRLVALYKQRRDSDVMGSLTVFPDALHDADSAAGGPTISLEAVVSSCLAVVVYERVGWQNLLGD